MIILSYLYFIFVFIYFFSDLIIALRNRKYQKIWNQKKAIYLKIDPNITRSQLCEQYVMFCKKNNCKVEF